MGDKAKLQELPTPIGDFVIENAKGVHTPNGTYFHYSEVCELLKKYDLLTSNSKYR